MDTLQAFVVVLSFVYVSSIDQYDFHKYCKRTIPIPKNGEMILNYDSWKQIGDCFVDVHNNRNGKSEVVLAHFRTVQITPSTSCNISRLDIYDDSKVNPDKNLTASNGICSSKDNLTTINFNSTQKHMTFNFKNGDGNSSFQILLTTVHKGNCTNNDFSCGNGFCIPDNLVCSGYNNCGNGHDELACILGLAVWAIVLIVLASMLVLICACAVMFCLICRPRRRQMYRQI